MSQTARELFARRIWKWVLLISPIAAVLILQAYILVPGRPYVWAKVRKNQLACVLQGPMTPFGRVMFIGGLPRSHSGPSPVKATRVGGFFLDRVTAMLDQGFGFEPNGRLYVRLSKRRIWSVDPWRGDAKLLAVIDAQDPVSEGAFSSNEFCVAGDTVWFETLDREGYDTLFVQVADSHKPAFRQSGLFQILGCTEDAAYVASEVKTRNVVSWVRRNGNRSKVLECAYRGCILRNGDWRPGEFLYLRKYKGSYWFNLKTLESDERLVKAGKRYRGFFGCDGSLFFLTYELEHEDGPRTRVEEMNLGSREFVKDYWVDGVVKLLAADCVVARSKDPVVPEELMRRYSSRSCAAQKMNPGDSGGSTGAGSDDLGRSEE